VVCPRREVSRPKAVHIRGGRPGDFGGGTPATDDHPAGRRLVFRVLPWRRPAAWGPGRCRGGRRQGLGGVALLG
jgi:hypothetical protein